MVASSKIKLVEDYLISLRHERRVEIIGADKIESFKALSSFASFETEHELVLADGRACLRGVQISYEEVKYGSLVPHLIRLVYDLDAELAILRQRDVKPEEFQEYNEYVEYCKLMADEYVTFVDNLKAGN